VSFTVSLIVNIFEHNDFLNIVMKLKNIFQTVRFKLKH